LLRPRSARAVGRAKGSGPPTLLRYAVVFSRASGGAGYLLSRASHKVTFDLICGNRSLFSLILFGGRRGGSGGSGYPRSRASHKVTFDLICEKRSLFSLILLGGRRGGSGESGYLRSWASDKVTFDLIRGNRRILSEIYNGIFLLGRRMPLLFLRPASPPPCFVMNSRRSGLIPPESAEMPEISEELSLYRRNRRKCRK